VLPILSNDANGDVPVEENFAPLADKTCKAFRHRDWIVIHAQLVKMISRSGAAVCPAPMLSKIIEFPLRNRHSDTSLSTIISKISSASAFAIFSSRHHSRNSASAFRGSCCPSRSPAARHAFASGGGGGFQPACLA